MKPVVECFGLGRKSSRVSFPERWEVLKKIAENIPLYLPALTRQLEAVK